MRRMASRRMARDTACRHPSRRAFGAPQDEVRRGYLFSTAAFNCASPFSKSGPSILSMDTNRHIALPMKFCLPNMLQITLVWPPASENTKSELLVPAKGRVKSVRVAMRSFGLLSVIAIVPAPTLSLPSHANEAPTPDCGPENIILALGSSFAQGDQSSHLLRSFTCANTAAAGAAMIVWRVRR